MAKPITIKITGDAASLEREIDSARQKLNQLEATVDKTSESHSRLGKAASGAGDGLKALSSEFTSRLGPAGQMIQDRVEGVINGMGGLPIVAGAAAAGVAGLGVAMFKVGEIGLNAFTEFAAQTRQIQEATGLSADAASRFADMADDIGVGVDTAAGALAKLSKNVETNGQKFADAGIQIAHFSDGSVDLLGTLGNVADAFASTEDPAKRAEIGTLAFGKAWVNMVPILAQGSAGIRDLMDGSMHLTDAQQKTARQLELTGKQLKDSWDEAKLAIGEGIAPKLADMASGIANVNEKMSAWSANTLNLSSVAGAAFTGMTLGLDHLLGAFGKHNSAQDEAKKKADEAASALKQQQQAQEDSTAAQEEAAAQLELLKAADDRRTDAVNRATQADKELKQAQDDLTNAVVASADVALNYERAERTTIKALEDQHTSETNLAVAVRDHGASSDEAKAASGALADQTINTKEAILRQADAAVQSAEHNAELAGSHLDAGQKASTQREFLSQLAGTLAPGSGLRAWLDGYIGQLGSIPAAKNTTITTIYRTIRDSYYGIQDFADNPIARASGGPLRKGQLALVGEEGPELIVPTGDGMVLPAGQTHGLLSGSGASGPSNVSLGGGGGPNIYISGVIGDKDAVIRWVHEGLRRYDSARSTTR